RGDRHLRQQPAGGARRSRAGRGQARRDHDGNHQDGANLMRLLIVGSLKGQLTTATKIAMDRGANVTHAVDIDQALNVLRSGKGADLLMDDLARERRDLLLTIT